MVHSTIHVVEQILYVSVEQASEEENVAKKVKCPPAQCKTVKGKRHCPIQIPIWGTSTCRPRRKDEFDPSSFFSVKSGKATVVIGCPRGKYDKRAGRCTVGTRAYKLIL